MKSLKGIEKLILMTFDRWICELWNRKIAPVVREAVIRGTGKETSSDGQQKVANTALYVLMQKAVVPGCPLSGQGTNRLFADQYKSMYVKIIE